MGIKKKKMEKTLDIENVNVHSSRVVSSKACCNFVLVRHVVSLPVYHGTKRRMTCATCMKLSILPKFCVRGLN